MKQDYPLHMLNYVESLVGQKTISKSTANLSSAPKLHFNKLRRSLCKKFPDAIKTVVKAGCKYQIIKCTIDNSEFAAPKLDLNKLRKSLCKKFPDAIKTVAEPGCKYQIVKCRIDNSEFGDIFLMQEEESEAARVIEIVHLYTARASQ